MYEKKLGLVILGLFIIGIIFLTYIMILAVNEILYIRQLYAGMIQTIILPQKVLLLKKRI